MNRELLELARNQFGLLSRSQLLGQLGWSSSAISRAYHDGRFVRVLPSVVRLTSAPDTFASRCMAVQLACDGVGFLGSLTAARIVGLRRLPSEPIFFTVPVGFRRAMPGWIRLLRTGWYDHEGDRTTSASGLVVAAPCRMLFGLAAELNQYRFERAAEDTWHLGLTTPAEAADYLDRHRCRGKDGVARMERWLEKALTQDRPAQSELERDLLDALDRVGLPPAARQHPLTLLDGATIHLDIAWPTIRLAVEPGASWWHGGDAGQRRDQLRDIACGEVGWQVFRLDETLRDDPLGAARRIRVVHRARTELFVGRSA